MNFELTEKENFVDNRYYKIKKFLKDVRYILMNKNKTTHDLISYSAS